MINKLIDWLSEHRLINLGVLTLLFSAIIFLHDTFVQLSVKVMWEISYTNYDVWVALVFLVISLSFVGLFIRDYLRIKRPAFIAFGGLILILSSIVLHSRLMFLFNIELIHSLQFGLLALFVFPLSRSYWITIMICTSLGLVDELYQYLWLYPSITDYFDFNDVVMDQLGVGLVLMFIYNSGIKHNGFSKWAHLFRNSRMILLISALLIFTALSLTGLLAHYAGDATASTFLTLNKAESTQAFWHFVPMYNREYHILSPWEGVGLITLLVLGIGALDRTPEA